MKLLVFDTETTGLPESRNTSILETSKWPHIVQISWILYDDDERKILVSQDFIIKCKVDIPESSSKIHGITNECSQQNGVKIEYAMKQFNNDLKFCIIKIFMYYQIIRKQNRMFHQFLNLI